MVKLSEVAPAKPLKTDKYSGEDHILHITLDNIESETGSLLKRNYAPVNEAGNSTHWFNSSHVLYSKLRPYLNKVYLPDETGIGTTELVPMLPNEKVLDRRYLAYFLRSKNFVDWVTLQTAGAKMPRVSMKVFWDHEIPLPPMTEQKRIAAILDKADAIRRKRQQAIQLADDFLRAVFLDMFGPSVDREGWKPVSFSDVTVIDAPMVDPRDEPYLDMLHIGPDRIEKNTGRLLPALTARDEQLISKKFLFDNSYILYSKIRPYLRKVALPEFVGLCSADMYPIKPIEGKLTREYLWKMLLSDEFTQYTETLPSRANIPKLNRKELANYQFRLPPISLQKKFSDIFSQFSKAFEKDMNGEKKSVKIFNSLSQKAFKGLL